MASSCIRPSSANTPVVSLVFQRVRVGQELVDLLVGEPPLAADRRVVELGGHAGAVGRELDERASWCSAPCPAAGWPGRWRSARAAWASRGRAGRRWSPRSRASPSSGEPAGTKCATSAMCTPSRQWPLSSCSSEIASSKSRASTGSMVTIVSPVRSSRSPTDSSNCSAWARAVSSTSSGNRSGRLNSRMIDSVSTPGLPRAPRTSTITPSPGCRCVGKRIISMTTLSPSSAFLAPGSPTGIGSANDVPSIWTQACAAAFEVDADELVRLAFDDLDDRPAAARLAAARRLEPDLDHVAGGRVAGLAERDEDVAAASGGRRRAHRPHEAVAFRGAAELAGDQPAIGLDGAGRRLRPFDQVFFAVRDLAFPRQPFDGLAQFACPLLGQPQLLGDQLSV